MKTTSISDIRKELSEMSREAIIEVCLRLARFKKENKEMIAYRLFHVSDNADYIEAVKQEITAEINGINKSLGLYFINKSLRRIVKLLTRYARYTDDKEMEVVLLIYFLQELKDSGIRYRNHSATSKLYDSQRIKALKLISVLHEDLQFDYTKELNAL